MDVQCAIWEVQTEFLYIRYTISGLQQRQYDRLKIWGCQSFDCSSDTSPLSGKWSHGIICCTRHGQICNYVMNSVNISHALNVVTVQTRTGNKKKTKTCDNGGNRSIYKKIWPTLVTKQSWSCQIWRLDAKTEVLSVSCNLTLTSIVCWILKGGTP